MSGDQSNNQEKSEEFSKDYKKSRVVIIPVPYDGTSTYGKGADKGPKALLNAYPNLEFYDCETDSDFYPDNIFIEKPVTEKRTPEKMVEKVQSLVEKHLENNKKVVLIGGEHSVSAGSIYAHAKKYEDMTVLQFDAHADLRSDYHGTKNNHACIMSRAQEVAKTVQVGIRSVAEIEKTRFQKVFFAHEIVPKNNHDWMYDIINSLTDNVYITVDLDVFDSAIMPSTGTPEPGGLSWYQVVETIKKVAKEKNIVGADIVELLPRKENPAPDFLAAKLLFKILVYDNVYGGKSK